jgi:hypothetical protein
MNARLRSFRTSSHRGGAVPDVPAELLHDLPARALGGRVIGRKSKDREVTVVLEDAGVVVKCRPLASRWTRHSVRGEFRAGQELGRLIPVAEPLAWLEPHDPDESQTSYLVLRLLPEASSVRHLLGSDEIDRTKLLNALGQLVGRFHAAGWTHGDLTLKNVLLARDHLHLIDLDHVVRLPPYLRSVGRMHDLRTLRVKGRSVMGRADCREWMRAYADARGLSPLTWRLHLAVTYLFPKRRRALKRAAIRAERRLCLAVERAKRHWGRVQGATRRRGQHAMLWLSRGRQNLNLKE